MKQANKIPAHSIRSHSIRKMRGISLLENLIALLILSIGLLGLAGLQASSFRNSKDATYRAIATQQATDMVNRIRANKQGIANGEYRAIPTNLSSAPSCDTRTCNASELALFDEWEWINQNASLLPGGTGSVVGIPLAILATDPLLSPMRFTVTVMWDGDRTGETGTGCDPANAKDLDCLTLQVVAP